MMYIEKLRDPRWQRKRLEVLQANGWRCEDCGAGDKTLEVHHCFYIRQLEPWDYGLDLLMCLCRECHEFRQGREQAAHIILGKAMRIVPIEKLETAVWDALHDEIVLWDAPNIPTRLD